MSSSPHAPLANNSVVNDSVAIDPLTPDEQRIYRALQQHLDDQAVGFPATSSQAEIRVLKHIFSVQEAQIATCLTYKSQSLDAVFDRAQRFVTSKQTLSDMLSLMEKKGGIEAGGPPDKKWYRNAPLVVGMYEYQLGRLNPSFIKDFNEYTSDRKYGISFLSASLPQMRTIPIEKSITIENYVADFDSVVDMLKNADGPFAICECICRKKQHLLGHECQVTRRKDTCLAVGDLAHTAIRIEMGKRIDRDNAISILKQNQEQGLVIQPSNTRTIDFICSCCGCCCGMLRMQKQLPKPLDFWVSNFYADVNKDLCNGCGRCEKRCQVDAISRVDAVSLTGKRKKQTQQLNQVQKTAVINPHRCIGCGLCVPVCKSDAATLHKNR